MKLAYFTTITTPDTDAQSLQVAAMAEAFSTALTGEFIFVSPATSHNSTLKTKFRWERVRVPLVPRALRTALMVRKMRACIRREKITHVYTRDIAIAWAARQCGVAAIYEAHKPFTTFFGRFLFWCIQNRIMVVAISQKLADIYAERYGVRTNKLFVAHDGVWMRDFEHLSYAACHAALRRLAGESRSAHPIAVYSGNLKVSGKGTGLIIEAARSLPNVLFVIAGGRLPHVPHNVISLGYQKAAAIPALLAGADVLLLPFTRELKTWQYHSALKIFEYMGSGRPIVASHLGSITEVLNNTNAVLFNPDEPGALAKGIATVLSNANHSAELGHAAKRQAAGYDWLERARRIITFITR